MGTFLKYVFYVIVIVVVYLIGRGIYEGSITEKTTVGQVVSDVGTGSKELVKDAIKLLQKTKKYIIIILMYRIVYGRNAGFVDIFTFV